MELLPLSSIIIPSNRIRRHFDEDDLNALANSIHKIGLMHPLVLRNAAPILVAGERRLRALRLFSDRDMAFKFEGIDVRPGHVPIVRLGELSEMALAEAELEENVVRADLSIAETAAAYARLDELRRAQAEIRGERHTTKDTASEILGREALGSARQKVEDLLIIAKHLDNAEVARARSVSDALKIIRKDNAAAHYAQLASNTAITPSDHTLLRGDVRQLLGGIPDETFDCIVTDPPYGVEADAFGDQAAARHTYSDSPDDARELYSLCAEQGFRVCKRAAHCFVFCDLRAFADLELVFSLAGWRVWPWPLIWAKGSGMLPDPLRGPRRTYESILYALKGEKHVQFVAPDVIAIPSVATPRRGAEKPVDLYAELLRRSCLPGDLVLDPFCGTGPVFPAATRLKLRATGIEIDPVAQGIALSRLAGEAQALAALAPPASNPLDDF